MPRPTLLDSNALLEIHDRIRHGCHRCQLRSGILHLGGETNLQPSEHDCAQLSPPAWGASFRQQALFPSTSALKVPPGLLCYDCRCPQTFCRNQHPSNPYDLRPCLYNVSVPPPGLHPGSPDLWCDLVIFLLGQYPAVSSSFVLANPTSAGHVPPSSWSQLSLPLSPLDFQQWFSHTGPGMTAPSNLVSCFNGACLVVHLFKLHFRI